jgi:hypothetical protein
MLRLPFLWPRFVGKCFVSLSYPQSGILAEILTRCVALAGIAPPATLSVVQGFNNQTQPVTMKSLDWNSAAFFDIEAEIPLPSSEVLRIAILAAQSNSILPLTPPASNSSFHVHFFGPTVQCSVANSSQQPILNQYSTNLANGTLMTVTKALFESGNLTWGSKGVPPNTEPLMNVYSAFSPLSGAQNWFSGDSSFPSDSPDQYNNWPPNIEPYLGFNITVWNQYSVQQLWIQTADQSMVCIMGNASFDVWFEFVNNVQTIAEYSISNFVPFWAPLYASTELFESPTQAELDTLNPLNSYMAIYLALTNLLNGNVSTTLTESTGSLGASDWDNFDGNVTIYDGSSSILQYGLSACDDFTHGYVSTSLVGSSTSL